MTEPYFRGAVARAVFAGRCLFLVEALIVAPHAHAAGRYHSWRHHQAHHHQRAIDPHTAAIGRGWNNPFAGFAPLFQPPTPPMLAFDEPIARPIGAVVIAAGRGGVAALVRAKAELLGVPVRLALAIAHFESGFRMVMQGADGERGAMQVLPQTARQVGVTGNLYGAAGIEAGVRYLKLALELHRRAGWCAVASAYNSGVWRGSHCTAYGRTVVAMAALR